MEHLSHKRKVTIMVAIMAAMFFASINQTIVGVALPRIIAKLGGMDYYPWIMTIYLLTSTLSTILVGKLSDIYGRKYFILSGIVIFMIGAFLTGTSKDILQMILYRGIQGVGAGIIMSTAFTAIGDIFSPRERGSWAGLMSAVFGISSILGPGLGGYIVDHLDWHWIFWLFLPLGLLAFLLIFFLFPKPKRQESQSIDFLGSLFLTILIVSLLLAFSWAGTKYAWNSPQILGLFLITLLSLALLLITEARVKTPVLPLSLFKNRVISLSLIIGFLMNGGMFGALIYMPFYVQGVLGVSATYAGYVTMPMSISMFSLNAYAGYRMTKTGKYKKMAILGTALMGVGMALMSIMNGIPLAVISMIIFGSGLGLSMPVLMIVVQNEVDWTELGVATATLQLFRNLGGTIGIAVMGTILSVSIAGNLASRQPIAMKELAQFQDPQILLDPAKLSEIQQSLPAGLQDAFAQLVDTLREVLAAALSHVFLTTLLVLTVTFLLTFFLKEVPLRNTIHKEKLTK